MACCWLHSTCDAAQPVWQLGQFMQPLQKAVNSQPTRLNAAASAHRQHADWHRLPCTAVAGPAAGQPGGGMLMSGTPGQQVVLLPPALMAQQMAAAAGGMGLALQQTPQGLQMVQRTLDGQPAAAAGQQGASSPAAAQ